MNLHDKAKEEISGIQINPVYAAAGLRKDSSLIRKANAGKNSGACYD